MGSGAEGMRYRFQWNFPVFFSPHELGAPLHVFTVPAPLHQRWRVLGHHIAGSDPRRGGEARLLGRPHHEGQHGRGILRDRLCRCGITARNRPDSGAGSDDGLIHVTRDGGTDMARTSRPKGMPVDALVNSIEVDPHRDGGLYVAATRYKMGDYAPYLYPHGRLRRLRGALINEGHRSEGISRASFALDSIRRAAVCRHGVRFVRQHRRRRDIGSSFQQNLPEVPITDLALKDNDLIVATQGRSFWVLDDLDVLVARAEGFRCRCRCTRLFQPHPTVGYGGGNGSEVSLQPAPTTRQGCVSTTICQKGPRMPALTFRDGEGSAIRTHSSSDIRSSEQLV